MSDEDHPIWRSVSCPHCGWPSTIRIDPGDTGDRWQCRNPGCRKVSLL